MDDDAEFAFEQFYSPLFQDVLAILQRHDPGGIVSKSADVTAIGYTPEYLPEAYTIVARLSEAHSEGDVQRIVHEEFAWWFGRSEESRPERLAKAVERVGPMENYQSIAHEIWLLINSKGSSND